MPADDPAFRDHLAWLGYLQPDGLVVSPAALVDSQIIIDRSQTAVLQQRLTDFTEESESEKGDAIVTIPDFVALLTRFLEWPEDCLWGATPERAIPDSLRVPLRELEQDLIPTYALRHPRASEMEWVLLVKVIETGAPFDQRQSENARGWNASEHQRFERLLRETQVSIGLLTNHREIRLVYAPRGESTGSITFPVSAMGEISGRLILGAFHQLLKGYTLLTAPAEARLLALLKKSRDYQANVSTKLAEQVVEALYELLRGFQSANGQTHGELLRAVMENKPNDIYRGLLNTLLRVVFLLYAEDRGLMPTSGLYVRNYSLHGLFERLRADAERYPDTMDYRFGAWSQLLAVFRLVFNGSKNPLLTMPPRRGYLFDPEPFPFLEGRNLAEPAVPLVPDGTIFRVLSNLFLLDGERLSYKTLDVEQIGSVYETIMGFRIEQATGRMIALKPKKRHGAPIHVDLDALVAQKAADREKTLVEVADTKLPETAAKALKAADSVDDLLAMLEKRIDKRATPSLVAAGAIILQPTDERRRSGSHYTPRSFTEPIVRKTLGPILARIGAQPKAEQILELKIADIAVGSAAFLVETCRQLADQLVAAWHHHNAMPRIPDDEDEVLYARRIVAQRCLYGVDRNPMAVDLAKLSLWLATMAKDHPFTFLDHAIKCGDSLVGLTNKQIATFHWDTSQGKQRVLGQEQMEKTIKRVAESRKEILEWPDDNEWAVIKKREFLGIADEAANPIRTTGDLLIAAFFAGLKPKERQRLRDEFLEKRLELLRGQNITKLLSWQMQALKELSNGEHPIRPFHWELEFPEVFSREIPGFDGIVGNPPFAGKNTMIGGNRFGYLEWLKSIHEESHGNADLVAHFFRAAFLLIRQHGTFGLIATNSIGQGDTRATGLRWICSNDGVIYAARKRARWPGPVAVVVSIVNVFKGNLSGPYDLDGRSVDRISAYLFHSGGHENPYCMNENKQKSFIGSYVLGMGFTFDADPGDGEANSLDRMYKLIANDSRNALRIRPYLGGEELNEHPEHKERRYVINFEDFPLRRENLGTSWTVANDDQRRTWIRKYRVPLDYPGPVANDWPELLQIVEEKVRPERLKQGSIVNPDRWWMFARPATNLTHACEKLIRFLAISRVRATGFAFLPSGVVCSEQLVAFPFHEDSAFALLQARPHEVWSHFFSGSAMDLIRYAPTDCFETFPFPPYWESNSALGFTGQTYYEFRATLMIRRNEGLTKIYNRFHDPKETSPDILTLRELHSSMDQAVLNAYGWADIPTKCQFILDYEEEDEQETESHTRKKKKPWRYRWPDDIRDEVLARLLALNTQRHAEAVASGLQLRGKVAKSKPAKSGTKRKIVTTPAPGGEPCFPSDIRFPSPTPELYSINLITALLSARPQGLPWSVLRDAFAAVTHPSLMLDLALPEDKQRVSEWSQRWNETATPTRLIPALKTMTSANIAVQGSGLDAIFSLQDGPKKPATDFIGYDAWLALRVVEPLSTPVLPPDELEDIDEQLLELIAKG